MADKPNGEKPPAQPKVMQGIRVYIDGSVKEVYRSEKAQYVTLSDLSGNLFKFRCPPAVSDFNQYTVSNEPTFLRFQLVLRSSNSQNSIFFDLAGHKIEPLSLM